MAEALGIENIKTGVKFAINLTNQIAKTKKFRLITIFGFVDDLSDLGEVIEIWPDIKAEHKDLSEEEKAELRQYVRDEFDIPNDEVEGFIEDSFELVDRIVSLVGRAKRLKKK